MKYIFLCLLLVGCFGDDAKQIKEAESGGGPTLEQSSDTPPKVGTEAAENGFVEENNECICTKEYNPVCGSNGKMYPSPCQAGCDGVTDFTEGACDQASEQANDM